MPLRGVHHLGEGAMPQAAADVPAVSKKTLSTLDVASCHTV